MKSLKEELKEVKAYLINPSLHTREKDTTSLGYVLDKHRDEYKKYETICEELKKKIFKDEYEVVCKKKYFKNDDGELTEVINIFQLIDGEEISRILILNNELVIYAFDCNPLNLLDIEEKFLLFLVRNIPFNCYTLEDTNHDYIIDYDLNTLKLTRKDKSFMMIYDLKKRKVKVKTNLVNKLRISNLKTVSYQRRREGVLALLEQIYIKTEELDKVLNLKK